MYSLHIIITLFFLSAFSGLKIPPTLEIKTEGTGIAKDNTGSKPPEFGTYQAHENENVKILAPAPYLESEVGTHSCSSDPVCEDSEHIFYTFHGFMKEVSCEEAFTQTNLILNGGACYLKAEITDDKETLWQLCPATMYNKCGPLEKVLGSQDHVESVLLAEGQRSVTL